MRLVHRLLLWSVVLLLVAMTGIAQAQMSSLANRNLEQLSISGGALSVNVSRWGGSAVTGGAGAVAAGTPRVTLGSDDPAVVVLQAVGHTRNEAFGQAAAIGGELDDTAPVAATEGNVSPLRITAQRGGHVNLRSNAGTEVGTATDPVRVDPTGTTRQPVDPIAGQVGVQGGSGIATALTQRAVLATDIALPAGTNILGRVGTDLTTPGTTNAVAPISGQAGVQGGSGIATALTQRVVLATDVALPTGANVIGGVTQSGIWTVQPGNTQNTIPWLTRLHDGTNTLGVFFDLDTGVGTQWELGINLRKSASGGSVEFGTSTDPVRTDPTGTTTQPVSGTVTANQGTANATPWNENVAQINGVVPLMGAGVTGPGSPRISIASNANTVEALFGGSAPAVGNFDEDTSGAQSNILLVTSRSAVYNGATWDSVRGGIGPTGTGVQRVVNANNDPCQTSGITKSSVVLNVTTSAQVIAASGSTVIYVCGFTSTVGGTAPTYKFHYGTGAVCATGSTDLTGTFLPTIGSFNIYSPGMTAFATAASAALCITTGGTTPSVQGVLTYVQQ